MPKTGVVKKPFPYAVDGVHVETLKEGRVLAFPDRIYSGLEAEGYIVESEDEAENSVTEAAERDVTIDELHERLLGMSDQGLKDIIARSGTPVSGNLVHAVLIAQAKAQLLREAAGKEPAHGVDANSGVTEQPLAAPGEPVPPAAPAAVEAAQEATRNQLGDPLPHRTPRKAKGK